MTTNPATEASPSAAAFKEPEDNDPAADFSCYFTLHNQLSTHLIRDKWGTSCGNWVAEPPQTIKPGFTTPQMRIKDKFGAYGSAGWVTYRTTVGEMTQTIRIDIECPTTGSNAAKITSNSPEDFYLSTSPVQSSGHPLTIQFTVEAAPVK